ncbi:MAG: hypothetical protein EZS28_025187 [Streblomastix strix]|uniref:Uncharacterized protein n=1 Tax=Streblomastix strix TaxID=222440 RepID=A0A5J4V9U4_9EUKA|nr:MAG: hypothetical protein EZS28_025187 [Streblomastix strix]
MKLQETNKFRFNQVNRWNNLQYKQLRDYDRVQHRPEVYTMLIPPIPAYSQQQTPRIPLLPYPTEKNQQLRQSQRSISPTHKRADESEDDDFLDAIIPGITMPYLPPHMNDIEITQRT